MKGRMKMSFYHELETLSINTFDLRFPLSEEELKAKFRAKAKEHHPDSGKDEDATQFIKIKEAFNLLIMYKTDPAVFADGQQRPLMTFNDIPLSELGRGLGSDKNGVPCENCEGKGYTTEIRSERWQTCETCEGMGCTLVWPKCRPCRGTGRFTQKYTGKEVDCRVCKGTGEFRGVNGENPRLARKVGCNDCFSSGIILRKREISVEIHSVCRPCKGAGEIEILNPVLQKLAILRSAKK